MALKDLIKTFRMETILVGPIQRYLVSKRADGGNAFQEETYIGPAWHPSLLSIEECLRRLQYRMLKTPESNPRSYARNYVTFDVGHALALNIKGYLYDMGWLLGAWECVYCGHRWLDMENPSPRVCPNCGKTFVGYVPGEGRWHDLIYREVPIRAESPVETTLFLRDPKTGKGQWVRKRRKLFGHADAMVKTSVGKKLFLEIKTIKNRDVQTPKEIPCFEDVSQPLPSHLYQLQLYLGYNEWGVTEGLFLYVGKNTHQLKEFPVARLDPVIDDMRDKMVAVDSSIDRRELLPRKCRTQEEGKNCPFVDVCFQHEHFDQADFRDKK